VTGHKMPAIVNRWLVVGSVGALFGLTAYGQASRALIDQYCVGCHNERIKTASLMLDKLDLPQTGGNLAVWEKVARKLRAGDMPPAGRPRPAKADANAFASSLETALDAAAAAQPNRETCISPKPHVACNA
jgi:hypothetical protein